jgi:parvulin-like peptidyl-prolyl isomerase
LRARLEYGATFEDLAKEVFEDPGLATNGGSLGTFGWGEMEPALEEAAFSIPVGAISEPLRASMGYAILKVEKRVENRFVTESDYVKVREKLYRAVVERKFSQLIKDELRRIEGDLVPSFDENIVGEVFKSWHLLIETPALPSEQVGNRTQDLSGMELVRFKSGAWTVNEFVKRLTKTTERQKRRVKRTEDVRSMAIGLAAREVLLEKANRLGLASDSTVVEAVRHGREAFLLKRWASAIADTVVASGWDEQVLLRKYEETKTERAHPPEVNVAEILVRTEGEAVKLMLQLKGGAGFTNLARKNSIRLWAAKRGGELGFGTEAAFGPMGKKFFAARVGEIVGPEKVDPYYGIFKILERREGRPMTFDETRDQVVRELTQTRQMEARKIALDHLRQGSPFSIDNDLLANIVLN